MKGTNLEFWLDEFKNKYYAHKTTGESGIHKEEATAEGDTLEEALDGLIDKLK